MKARKLVTNALSLSWVCLLWLCSTALADGLPLCGPTDALIESADAYIIGKVGEKYFRENYERVPARSAASPCRRKQDQQVTYRYKPLAKLFKLDSPAALQGTVTVKLSDCGGYAPFGFVAQLSDGNIVEPKITKTEACNLAYKVVAESNAKPKMSENEFQSLHYCSAHIDSQKDRWNWSVHVPVENHPGILERIRDFFSLFSCRDKAAVVTVDAVNGEPSIESINSSVGCF